jgi:hypothetical protein
MHAWTLKKQGNMKKCNGKLATTESSSRDQFSEDKKSCLARKSRHGEILPGRIRRFGTVKAYVAETH